MTDYRLPEYRRETFLKFYAFHTKYGTHPGCVYFLMPWLARHHNWDGEQRLWFAYLNGNTQNPVTSWIIFEKFPSPEAFVRDDGDIWFNENWGNLQWDMDRRYQKKDLPQNANWYYHHSGNQQVSWFREKLTGTDEENFEVLWEWVRKGFPSFGRLAAFSYIEYLKITGLPVECNNLFFEDIDGSKSHRNGLAIVLGLDDLDWNKKQVVKYSKADIEMFKVAGARLLYDAVDFGIEDASYFTLESALCTYKSWHRPNRRYPNVYADMLHDRIKWAESKGWDVHEFWQARRECLPQYLRQEDNSHDPGLSRIKQNYYLEHGVPVMMSKDYPEFDNELDRIIWS